MTLRVQRFNIEFVSSEAQNYSAKNILSYRQDSPGWSTSKYSNYPQMLVMRFNGEVEIQKIKILSHENRISKRMELYVGNVRIPFEEINKSNMKQVINYRNVNFEKVGFCRFDPNTESNHTARELKTIMVNVTGSFIKLVFDCCFVNRYNFYNQVGIVGLQVHGKLLHPFPGVLPEDSKIKRSGAEKKGKSGIDDETKHRLAELKYFQDKAVRDEDFLIAEKYRQQIKWIQKNFKKIAALERKKHIAVENENFVLADQIKSQLDVLRNPEPDEKLKKSLRRSKKMDDDDDNDEEVEVIEKSFDEEVENSVVAEEDDDDDEQSTNYPNTRKVFHPENAEARVHHSIDRRSIEARRREEEVSEDDDDDDEEEEEEEEEVLEEIIEDAGRQKRIRQKEKKKIKVKSSSNNPKRIMARELEEESEEDSEEDSEEEKLGIRPFGRTRKRPQRSNPLNYDEMSIRPAKTNIYEEAARRAAGEKSSLITPVPGSPSQLETKDQFLSQFLSSCSEWQIKILESIYILRENYKLIRGPGTLPMNHSSSVLNVFGEYITKCLYCKTIRQYREISSQSITKNLGELEGVVDGQTIVIAILSFMKIGLIDQVHSNYFKNIILFRETLKMYGGQTKRSVLQTRIQPILSLLVSRLGDANTKRIKSCRETLLFLSEMRSIGPSTVCNKVMQIPKLKKRGGAHHQSINNRNNRRRLSPRSQKMMSEPWMSSEQRLSMFLILLKRYQISPTLSLTLQKVMDHITPYLEHMRSEVRKVATEITKLMYFSYFEKKYIELNKKGIPQKAFDQKYLKGNMSEGKNTKKQVMKSLGYRYESPYKKSSIPPPTRNPSPYLKRGSGGGGGKFKKNNNKKQSSKNINEEEEENNNNNNNQQQQQQPKKKKQRKRKKNIKKQQQPSKRNNNNNNNNEQLEEETEEQQPSHLDGVCPVCGKTLIEDSSKLNSASEKEKENIANEHMLTDCPMLMLCPNCHLVIQIKNAVEHMITQCDRKQLMRLCNVCKMPVMKQEYEKHKKNKSLCIKGKPKREASRCYLCREDIPPGIKGWKKHLVDELCPSNPRTVTETEKEMRGSPSKKYLTKRMINIK